MLRDKKIIFERLGRNIRLRRQLVREYALFLHTLFFAGDWFVTITFRDRGQDVPRYSVALGQARSKNNDQRQHLRLAEGIVICPPDPRLADWEPDSKSRRQPGPPVRDVALREILHWLLELGWEAAGRTRQEIFDRLAEGLYGAERKSFAKNLSKRCLICEVLNDPVTHSFFYDIEKVTTAAIGWVIAEELGRAGGRWHLHLLVHGTKHLNRKKWWKRAYLRFGLNRIEALHE